MQCSLVPRMANVRLVALDGRAACARFALVAGHRRVAEINAPGPLQQVAGGGRHVSQLNRCARQDRLRQDSDSLVWTISW